MMDDVRCLYCHFCLSENAKQTRKIHVLLLLPYQISKIREYEGWLDLLL